MTSTNRQSIFTLLTSIPLLILSVFPVASEGLPAYQQVRKTYVGSDAVLLDRSGEILQEARVDRSRRRLDWATWSAISPAAIEAVIQAEDARFFAHSGFDWIAVAGSLIQRISSGSVRGASTITMQLVSFLDKQAEVKNGRRSLWQKGEQIRSAWELEKSWTKTEIAEAYLNLVTFRGELQGITAAARGLFGKEPHGLDRMESLLLASLIRSPNASSSDVLRRASSLNRTLGWNLSEQDIDSKINLSSGSGIQPRISLAPHVAGRLLKAPPKSSAVTCTLDRKVQELALSRMSHHLASLRFQNARDGAVLVLDNRTGDVLAYASVCGRPEYSRFVDGVQAKRQAGSTLKPLLYAHSFDRRILTPASILDDTPLDIAIVNGIYQPRDYESEFKGRVSARVALASSLNVPAVRVLSLVGTEAFLRVLRQVGIRGLDESGDFYGPSLALGSADVSLWELTNAYRMLANGGEWTEPRLKPKGSSASGSSPKPVRVFSSEAVFLVSDILSDREARSSTFGLENSLSTRFWTAVKTGTSKDMRDNWCIGYSQHYTVGVWIGNFSGEPMWNVSGVTGASPVWAEVMDYLHGNRSSAKPAPPANVVKRDIQLSSGMEASRSEWFIRGTEPLGRSQDVGQVNQKILYPPSGTIMALDPDIPPGLQKVFFICESLGADIQWKLNDRPVAEKGKTIPWAPHAGKFSLSLLDREGHLLDRVIFEVRGPSEQ
jgi:penicillin-binding protein 1C